MNPRATKKSTRDPQLGDGAPERGTQKPPAPDTGTKRNLKHPESPEKDAPPSGADVDRPGQGDDEVDRQNQADGHHETASRHGSRDRLTKSGRLDVRQLKDTLEKVDKADKSGR